MNPENEKIKMKKRYIIQGYKGKNNQYNLLSVSRQNYYLRHNFH